MGPRGLHATSCFLLWAFVPLAPAFRFHEAVIILGKLSTMLKSRKNSELEAGRRAQSIECWLGNQEDLRLTPRNPGRNNWTGSPNVWDVEMDRSLRCAGQPAKPIQWVPSPETLCQKMRWMAPEGWHQRWLLAYTLPIPTHILQLHTLTGTHSLIFSLTNLTHSNTQTHTLIYSHSINTLLYTHRCSHITYTHTHAGRIVC